MVWTKINKKGINKHGYASNGFGDMEGDSVLAAFIFWKKRIFL